MDTREYAVGGIIARIMSAKENGWTKTHQERLIELAEMYWKGVEDAARAERSANVRALKQMHPPILKE